jgi:hypothetical protein
MKCNEKGHIFKEKNVVICIDWTLIEYGLKK